MEDLVGHTAVLTLTGFETAAHYQTFTNAYGIVGSFNATTGTLTFTGTSYVGYYREVLRLVTFSTSGSAVSTATRTFTVIATDDFVPTAMSSIPVTRNVTVTP